MVTAPADVCIVQNRQNLNLGSVPLRMDTRPRQRRNQSSFRSICGKSGRREARQRVSTIYGGRRAGSIEASVGVPSRCIMDK